MLARSDFRIFTATSGEEALTIHKREQVDLIIVDLDMSGISGDKLCSLIRNNPALKQVSVIIVCTGTASDLQRVSRCKANAHVTKPLRPMQFLEKVGQLLDVPERKSYRVLLKVTVDGEDGRESFFCSSQNISASGILIETDKVLAKGDRISCSFFLPRSEHVVASAEVMRIAPSSNGTYHYGIRYLDLDPAYRAAIEAFIASRA